MVPRRTGSGKYSAAVLGFWVMTRVGGPVSISFTVLCYDSIKNYPPTNDSYRFCSMHADDFVNARGLNFEFGCDSLLENSYVSGLYSDFNAKRSDRRWRFECCSSVGKLHHIPVLTDRADYWGRGRIPPAPHQPPGIPKIQKQSPGVHNFQVTSMQKFSQFPA